MTEVKAAKAEVTVGLATKLGLVGAIILSLCTAITTVIAGNHVGETKLFATLATVVTVATVIGRMLQSVALLLKAPPALPEITPAPAPRRRTS